MVISSYWRSSWGIRICVLSIDCEDHRFLGRFHLQDNRESKYLFWLSMFILWENWVNSELSLVLSIKEHWLKRLMIVVEKLKKMKWICVWKEWLQQKKIKEMSRNIWKLSKIFVKTKNENVWSIFAEDCFEITAHLEFCIVFEIQKRKRMNKWRSDNRYWIQLFYFLICSWI